MPRCHVGRTGRTVFIPNVNAASLTAGSAHTIWAALDGPTRAVGWGGVGVGIGKVDECELLHEVKTRRTNAAGIESRNVRRRRRADANTDTRLPDIAPSRE